MHFSGNGVRIFVIIPIFRSIDHQLADFFKTFPVGFQGIQKFLRIDIPMVMSQLKLILVLTVIWGVQSYEGIFIMTRGGPGFETTVPGVWMYFNAMSFQRMGYACAIGVCLFALIFSLTVLSMRYFKSAEELEGAR